MTTAEGSGISALPKPSEKFVTICCELLSSGLPFSEVLRQTRPLAEAEYKRNRKLSAKRLLKDTTPHSMAPRSARQKTIWALTAGTAIPLTILCMTGMQVVLRPSEPLAVAEIPAVSQTQILVGRGAVLPPESNWLRSSRANAPIATASLSDANPDAHPVLYEHGSTETSGTADNAVAMVAVRLHPLAASAKSKPRRRTHQPVIKRSRDHFTERLGSGTDIVGELGSRVRRSPEPPGGLASATINGWGAGRFGPSPYSSNGQ
jgi:hypothetical protein